MKKTIASLIVIVLIVMSGCTSTEWPEGDLGNVIPELNGNIESVDEYSDSIRITFKKINKNEFLDYVKSCKDAGFTIDIIENNTSYCAFNEAGYKLDISYFPSEDMWISVDAPIKMSDFSWPKSEIAKLLPIPRSTYGVVEWEEAYGFVIYVGNTSKEDYASYVDAVFDMGFTENYSKGVDYFHADNSDGYSVDIDYKGFNIMFIRIDEPKKEVEPSQDANNTITDNSTSINESSNTSDSTDSTTNNNDNSNNNDKDNTNGNTDNNTNTEVLVNGMRPSFKEAMDSYEEFFDEYCAFMKKYNDSNDTMSMLNDYLAFLAQYAEMSAKLEKLGDEDLNSAELNYYIQVTNRINKKLIEIS